MMRCRWGMLVAVLGVACGGDGSGGGTSGGMSSSVGMTAELTSDEPTTDAGPGSSSSEGGSSSGAAEESSSSSGGELPEVDFETDVQPIFDANCLCHMQGASGMMTAPFLTLNQGISHGELVGVASMQSDLDRVAPGDLEASYLWHKLGGTQLDVGGMGTSMPPTGSLSQGELGVLRAWILGGAMP